MEKTKPRFLTVCLNPTLQRTLLLPDFRENEVNRTGEYYLDASGKGVNVTRVLIRLGCRAVHLTHAGGRDRELFLSLAAKDGVTVRAPDSGSEIRTCYTLLNIAGRTTTELVEEPFPAAPGTEAAVLREFERLLPEADCLIVTGTRTGGYSKTLYAGFVKAARAAGKKSLLDLRGEDLLACLPEGPDFIKPNFAEFAETFLGAGRLSEHDRDETLLSRARKKMEELFEDYGTFSLLTRGSADTLVFDGRRVSTFRPEPLVPVNTTGCGDAFTAGFAAAWGRNGYPRNDAANFSSVLARAVTEGHRCAGLNAADPRPGRLGN